MRRERTNPALLLTLFLLLLVVPGFAHDPKRRDRRPTKAAPALKEARKRMDAAKAKLSAAGKYSCCIKPSCDLCARTHGSCSCAKSVAQGKGTCGECLEGMQAGLSTVKGVDPKTVTLLPVSHHRMEAELTTVEELALSRTAMNSAKQTLVVEGRYSCCVGGGCDSCAHGADCACGSKLASAISLDTTKESASDGVCGECLDGWHSGHGSFAGVSRNEVKLESRGMSANPISGMGSGTSSQPESTPMRGVHFRAADWLVMLHADFKVGFNHQGGPRGVGKAESQNWLMAMAERNLGPGRLMLRGMFSAEALSTPHGGAPLLFQTGETYRRQGIVDAQHPHDLFMELAASYRIPFSERVSLEFYGGPVGEPALGPVAFMHRASAAENPAAPLSHHWQDSTHITHGVVTASIATGPFKFEASAFRGREPDEDRVRIEMGKLDSYSFRVGFSPTPNWSMQVSHGRLNDAGSLFPLDINRTTASISYNRASTWGNWATTAVWGRDAEPFGDTNAYLFESTIDFLKKNHLYTRIELVDKVGLLAENIFGRPGTGCRLVIPASPSAAPVEAEVSPRVSSPDHHFPFPPGPGSDPCPALLNRSFRIGAFTFGGVRDLVTGPRIRIGIGADTTFYHKPSELDAVYGGHPISFRVFMRFRTTEMR